MPSATAKSSPHIYTYICQFRKKLSPLRSIDKNAGSTAAGAGLFAFIQYQNARRPQTCERKTKPCAVPTPSEVPLPLRGIGMTLPKVGSQKATFLGCQLSQTVSQKHVIERSSHTNAKPARSSKRKKGGESYAALPFLLAQTTLGQKPGSAMSKVRLLKARPRFWPGKDSVAPVPGLTT